MKLNATQFISELTEYVNAHLAFVNSLKEKSVEELNWKPNTDSWSALECIEHLNLCLNFYVPEINRRIQVSSHTKSDTFKGNYIGNKFAASMLPKEKMKKVKTFKKVNPINSKLDKENVIETFILHQKKTLELLELSKQKNLSKIKTSTLLPLFKLRLGNTFQVIIYHNERHVVQAKNVLKNLK